MASASSQAVPAATNAAAVGSGTASNTSESIVGSHIFTIDSFSATKDLSVGESIESSVFRVGGHGWYIKCYPCGDVEESAGWVTLFLCRQEYHPCNIDSIECKFTLMESLNDNDRCFTKLIGHPSESIKFFKDDNKQVGTDFIGREELESLLTDDNFHVRCIVRIQEFPAVPMPDLAADTVSGTHTLTVDGYSKTRRALFGIDEAIESSKFHVRRNWYLDFYPWCKNENDDDRVGASLHLEDDDENDDEVKVRFEITLLTLAGQKISSIQDISTFSERRNQYICTFLSEMEPESSPLIQDSMQIRCDIAVVKGITAVQAQPERPDLHRHMGGLESQVGTDVTFDVGGELVSAHKCVLASRSTAFMAEFFGQARNNASVSQVLRIDDMEPRVFKALLHFIYTDALPEVREEDRVVLAQGLLVAADRYAMERLKLICADMLCGSIDATTAIATRELADKHGCLKLKEACIKVVRDWLANATP